MLEPVDFSMENSATKPAGCNALKYFKLKSIEQMRIYEFIIWLRLSLV